jgi:hypothetical protein
MNETPSKDAEVPRVAIDWYRSAPWWRLTTRTIGIAWRGSHLFLCAGALLLTHLLTLGSHSVFQPENMEPARWIEPAREIPSIVPFDRKFGWIESGIATEVSQQAAGPWYFRASDSFLQVWKRFASYPYQALETLTVRRAAYLLFNAMVVLAIWSFVGGCLARRTLVEVGTRITAPWMDTLRFVANRWLSIAWAVVMPLALIAICCLAPLVLGWIANIPMVGAWLSGLLMIPLVLFSLGLGWCASLSLFGFPLSTAAIVCEKQADAFDGVSRAAAYTFQRPVTLILAVAVAEWLGFFASALVSIVINTGFSIVSAGFGLGSSRPLMDMGTPWDGWIQAFVPLFVTAFGFSFFWSASAAIYLLLRKEVDHAEFDFIDMGNSVPPKPLPVLSTPLGDSPPESPPA